MNIFRTVPVRASSVLFIAQHNNKNKLAPFTANALTAIKQIGADSIKILVAGTNTGNIVKILEKTSNVNEIIIAEDDAFEGFLYESMEAIVLAVQKQENATHICAVATSSSKNYLPRVAMKLNASQISDVSKVIDANTFVRPCYATQAYIKLQVQDEIKVFTIRGPSFKPDKLEGGNARQKHFPKGDYKSHHLEYLGIKTDSFKLPDVRTTKVVICGGRGLGSAENFKMLYYLAAKLKGAVGATRSAVDAGYATHVELVGYTSKNISPDLYIAIGVSGTKYHIGAIKDSKMVVAINKDEHAPILSVADYGLVRDLFVIIPEFIRKLD